MRLKWCRAISLDSLLTNYIMDQLIESLRQIFQKTATACEVGKNSQHITPQKKAYLAEMENLNKSVYEELLKATPDFSILNALLGEMKLLTKAITSDNPFPAGGVLSECPKSDGEFIPPNWNRHD
jgi:hypothetical protein